VRACAPCVQMHVFMHVNIQGIYQLLALILA